MSPRYEFLMVNCDKGISLMNPDNLEVVKNIRTKYPVQCSLISPLIYSGKPRYHLIFAGGIASRD